MNTITINYNGNHHSDITHLQSATTISTDAPRDNGGKGESFSPTDLLAAALGSCTITILALKADSLGIDLRGSRVTVEKIMASNPRRVAQLIVDIYFNESYPPQICRKLEASAKACPVAQSLSASLTQTLRFHYGE